MNIFVLDESPVTSAQMQCDKHIVKMPLETAQMLCSVWHRYGVGDLVPYKEVHKKHPCTLWAGDSMDNYDWLWQDKFVTSLEFAPVLAYRQYYVNVKKDIAKWEKSRPMPNWFYDSDAYKVVPNKNNWKAHHEQN